MKRLSCFLLALGLALSLVVPAAPASADYQSQSNFWQWIGSNGGIPQKVLGYVTGDSVCPDSSDGKHHASSAVLDHGVGHYTCTCDYCGETFTATYSDIDNAYDDFADDMEFKAINSSGYVIYRPTVGNISLKDSSTIIINGGTHVNICDSSGLNPSDNPYITINQYSVNYTRPGMNTTFSREQSQGLYHLYIDVPYAGDYVPIYSTSWSCYQTYTIDGTDYADTLSGNYVSSVLSTQSREVDGEVIYYLSMPTYFLPLTPRKMLSVDFTLYMPELQFMPSPSFFTNNTAYTADYRPTSITGDYSVVGDNNEVSVLNHTIFNEDNSTFYNPVTDTSTNITNWNYDYSTRTYSMTDDNGDEKTLSYGDDNIVINDGGNTFTFYYGNVSSQSSGSGESGEGSGSGSGSGDSGESSGLLSQVGRLLGTLVSGLLGGITAFLSAILSALTNLVEVIGEGFNGVLEAVLGWFAELPELFHGFLDFMTEVFRFMPAEILSMLSFGVAAVVFVGILKALRR